MPSTPDCDKLAIEYTDNPCQSLRDQVCLASEPLVRSIISRINLPADPLATPDELYQVGVVAVLQALDKFDADDGARFASFAYSRIRGEIIDYLRRLDPLPRRRRQKVAIVRNAEDRLSQKRGSEVTENDVADHLKMELMAVQETKSDAIRRHSDSLFESRNEEGLRLVDCLEDKQASQGHKDMEWSDVGHHLAALSHTLSEREQLILELYFKEEMTLSDIGEIVGVTEARISQIRKKTLQKLADNVDGELRTAA